MKSRKPDLTALNQRQPSRWCPDPHRRGRRFKNRKAYTRKSRSPRRDGAFDFPAAIALTPTAQRNWIAIVMI